MGIKEVFKIPEGNIGRDSSGIALFMVLATVAVLAVLVTEFVYIAQISQSIAFGGLDQTQAHYLAKSGLKLSLLRLKAYKQIQDFAKGQAANMVPKNLLEKIWNFPFFYPIPTNIPGISTIEKDTIEKFQKESGLEGRFSAVIESESGKYNLNLLLPGYVPSASPSASPTATPVTSTPQDGQVAGSTPTPSPSPTAKPQFDPQVARTSLYNYLQGLLTQKTEADPDFATNYRDFRLDDLVDQISGWADPTYDRRTSTGRDKYLPKRAPFYSLSELRMMPSMDDEIYALFAPGLTVSTTVGVNVNTMSEGTLRALIPNLSKEDVKAFFKYRDSTEVDNLFKTTDEFFTYLSQNIPMFKNQQTLTDLKNDLTKRNISLITEENRFRIIVKATVGKSSRTIEAWVTLGSGQTSTTTAQNNSNGGATPPPVQTPPPIAGQNKGPSGNPESGLKITYMKIY